MVLRPDGCGNASDSTRLDELVPDAPDGGVVALDATIPPFFNGFLRQSGLSVGGSFRMWISLSGKVSRFGGTPLIAPFQGIADELAAIVPRQATPPHAQG